MAMAVRVPVPMSCEPAKRLDRAVPDWTSSRCISAGVGPPSPTDAGRGRVHLLIGPLPSALPRGMPLGLPVDQLRRDVELVGVDVPLAVARLPRSSGRVGCPCRAWRPGRRGPSASGRRAAGAARRTPLRAAVRGDGRPRAVPVLEVEDVRHLGEVERAAGDAAGPPVVVHAVTLPSASAATVLSPKPEGQLPRHAVELDRRSSSSRTGLPLSLASLAGRPPIRPPRTSTPKPPPT